MTIKPLLFIPSPRDIPEFKEATDKLKIDKLWVKYYPQEEAYTVGRNWFLEQKPFTHLVILPDDLIATQRDIDLLSVDAGFYEVISGWCNNTAGDTDDVDTNFSVALPPFQTANYILYNFVTIQWVIDFTKYSSAIIPVKHQGTALTFLSREIVEKIPFRTFAPPDLCLSYDLFKNGITQYVDLRCRMLHLRHPHGIMVGKKEKEIIFEHV